QDGIRPDSVELVLLTGNTPVAKAEVTGEGDTWTYTFYDLPKYEAGEEITYTVIEPNDVTGYEKKVDGLTVTNKHEPETVTVTVVKVWDDAEDQDGVRPDSLKVSLSVSGYEVTLDEGGDWTGKAEGLPKYEKGKAITYTWTEETISGYTLVGTEISEDGLTTTLTNRYTPETVDVTIVKVWEDADDQDGLRPDFLPVTLSDGTVVVLSEDNGWTATVKDLPKLNKGEEITYTWTEPAVEGYELTGTDISEDKLTTTLTNTHEPAVTGITGTKVWVDNNDNDGLRPESITVKLLADGEAVQTRTVTGDDWSFTFSDLPVYAAGKPISYTVDEDAVEGYVKSVTGNAADGFTITNTHATTTISVSGVKIWDDANDSDGVRPGSITVNLLANGKPVASRKVTGVGNIWFYTFTGLSQYADGKLIDYTVSEEPVDEYLFEIRGTTITNTHRPTSVMLTVRYYYMNGQTAAPTVQETHQSGDPYNVVSPVIPNYVATLLRVTGTMPDHDVEFVVIYTPAPTPPPGRPTTEIEEPETPLGLGNASLNAGECFE
ncbi:MAG: Cna B-type domain-containing protein, partial [Clostridia bacterium]|nr:Cna B-type domain-containing protein [Clostridia bacterium]